jgi:hypothetical protein
MKVHLPEEIAHHEPDLRFFFDLMVRKLHVNRHKGYAEGCTISEMVERARQELDELQKAVENESQFNVALEAVDVANFAFLAALVALRQTKSEFQKGRATS